MAKNRIILKETHAIMVCRGKGIDYLVLIDLDDVDKVENYPNTWQVIIKHNSRPYIRHQKIVNKKTTRTYLHHVILPIKKGVMVDHINGNPLDNRKANLRVVTSSENLQNRGASKNNKNGVRGVSRHTTTGKYLVQVTVKHVRYHIGLFDTIIEAEEAAKCARSKLHPCSVDAREAA